MLTSNYRAIIRTLNAGSNPTQATVTLNHCHRGANIPANAFKASFYDFNGLTDTMYCKDEDLFDGGTFNLGNGTFVSKNAAYGAIR